MTKAEIYELPYEELLEFTVTLHTDYSKITSAVKKLNKGLDDFVKELKDNTSIVADDAIIASYNASIPPDMATSDINVALRSSRKTMNAICKQRVAEIKLLTEDIK